MKRWVIAAIFLIATAGCEGEEGVEEPEKGEAFRVAKPLGTDPEELRAQIETIRAVTEPYDEVEAGMEPEGRLPLAANRAELEQQCVTALKEVAFCTHEEGFLELVGTVDGLRLSEERELFLNRVQTWFEPGGVRQECERLVARSEALEEPMRRMWQQAAVATESLCGEFGATLVEVDGFRWLQDLAEAEAVGEVPGEL